MIRTWARILSPALALAAHADARIINDHRDPSTGGSAYTLSVTPVFELTLTRTAGQSTTCETRNLSSPRTDPVLHILAFNTSNGNVTELARDDDSAGNLNARVSFRAASAGRYRLVMRAAGPGAGGTADLFCDGRPVWTKLSVGGAFKRLENLRQREILSTVPLPGGPRIHHLYFLDAQGKMLQRHESGANESASLAPAPSPLRIAMVGSVWPDPPGDLRLVRNDIAGHDADADGLGNELEQKIGTCSSRSGSAGNWECSRSVDPRDTDGDGIRDSAELLGVLNPAPYQWLPRWGADPRHKDLFIEVDYMMRSPTDRPLRMSRDVALQMAAIYGDPETAPLLRLAHAQSLNNPDLQPGIRLHLDTGLAPPRDAMPAELAVYGDWGGHDVASPVCEGGNCRGADAGNVWRNMMHRNRHGIFHYALGYPGGGGQAPFHSVALNIPLDSAVVAAHELGHTLGLDHNGPRHSGADANCKPNYPSLMSYAYMGHPGFINTFSDGFGRTALNNVQLVERGAVSQPASGPGRTYLAHLRDVFGYNVDAAAGNVDWDRDGVFATGNVRAYANDNRSGCEFTRSNSIRAAGLTDGAPALTRLGNRTLLVYGDERDRRLHIEYTDDSLACPAPGEGCGPGLTHKAVDESWNRDILSLDAHPVTAGSERKLLVVFRTSQGLFETTMSSGFAWSRPAPIRTSSPAVDEFSLTGTDTVTLLAFKNAQGNAVVKVRQANGSWDPDEVVRDASGAAIGPLGTLSAPAILHTRFADGTRTLLGAFPVTADGLLRLYVQDPASGRWNRSPWRLPDEPTFGRPALALEPVAPGSPLPGRLRMLYLHRNADGHHVVRMRTLQAKGPGAAATLELIDEDHDNVWYYGFGVDLLFEPGVDSNLRAAVATAMLKKGEPQPHTIELRPKADGIVDFVQRNWNDWEGLGVDLCRTLRAAGAQVNCPAWPF